MRVPAGEVQKAVVDQLAAALTDPNLLHRLIERCGSENVPIRQIRIMLDELVSRLLHGDKIGRRLALHTVLRRIELHGDRLDVEAWVPTLSEEAGGTGSSDDGRDTVELTLTVPITTVRAGGEVRLLLPRSPGSGNGRQDPALIALVAKAWTARQALTSTPGTSVDEAAAGMGLKTDYFRVLLRISFHSPALLSQQA